MNPVKWILIKEVIDMIISLYERIRDLKKDKQ